MSEQFERALEDIAGAAQRAAGQVPVETARSRVRRRRAWRAAATSTAAVAGVGAVAVAATAVVGGVGGAPQQGIAADPAPQESVSPTAAPGWVPGAAPCGEPLPVTPVESDRADVMGAIEVGIADGTAFTADPAGTWLRDDVFVMTQRPGEAGHQGVLTTTLYLVDETGAVAFTHARTPHQAGDPGPRQEQTPEQVQADLAVARLHEALDCRTGQPLTGTYRVVVSARSVDTQGYEEVAEDLEVQELAPVTFGPGGTAARPAYDDLVPSCGEQVPAELLAGTTDPAFTVDVDLSGVAVRGAGVHVPATVTRADDGAGPLRGTVPQVLRAVLVDADGVVVSDTGMVPYDSATTFQVDAGDSFASEIYTWFGCATTDDGPAATFEAPPGTYDLYVYDQLPAAGPDGTVGPRLAVGGPFRVSYSTAW